VDSGRSPRQNQGVQALSTIALVAPLAMALSGTPAWADQPQPPTRPTAGKGVVCKPPPAKTKIKVSLKPDTEVADLITWYATLTCTPLLLSSSVATAGKKVTILSPTPVTLSDLRELFLGALASVGLTVQPDGKFLHIIDATRARHNNTPVRHAR
jgi:hypothetical protein